VVGYEPRPQPREVADVVGSKHARRAELVADAPRDDLGHLHSEAGDRSERTALCEPEPHDSPILELDVPEPVSPTVRNDPPTHRAQPNTYDIGYASQLSLLAERARTT